MHHGMQALLEHHHHHEPHSNCHELEKKIPANMADPHQKVTKTYMMKQVNIKGAKRAGLQKVLWTANITQLSLTMQSCLMQKMSEVALQALASICSIW
jgi:hypothetical protein